MTDFEQKVIALADRIPNNSAHWAVELHKLVAEHRPKPQGPQPRVTHEVNWHQLYRTCVDGVESAYEHGYVDEDLEHYVYEAAMQAVFGKDIFQRLNKDLK